MRNNFVPTDMNILMKIAASQVKVIDIVKSV